MAEIYSSSWSESAMNNNANFPDGWAGGTTFPHIPPTGREMMAAIKREWNRSHPTLTTGGNGDAVTLTPATPITEYVTGQIFAAKMNVTLGAAGGATRTLNVSGKGGKKIYLPVYAGGYAQTALSGGEVKAGQPAFFFYDASLDSGAGGFVVYSQTPVVRGRTEAIEIALTSEAGAPPQLSLAAFVFRLPYAFTLTGAKTSLKTAQTSNGSGGLVTVYATIPGGASDVHLFNSPYLSIDNGETTSLTAATPLSLTADAAGLPAGTEITLGIFSGDGTARGLKVSLLGYQP